MKPSRFKSKYYTETKYVWNGRERILVPAENGTLFANGIYPTKIRPEDLPEHYMEGLYFCYNKGYLSAKGVKDLLYRPNKFSNHTFKDDFLYISYSDPFDSKWREENIDMWGIWDEADFYIWGHNIPRFLDMAEKYSGYDTGEIREQIRDKMEWLKETYPDVYRWEGGEEVVKRYCR